MAEHAEPGRKQGPAPAAKEPVAASGRHAELLNRRSGKALGQAGRLLDGRAKTAAPGPRPVQRAASTAAPNRTGLPDTLKAGVEALSGLSMDNVRVHRNSSRPAELQAHAFAQGSDIHLGPGQERHLPHEAWHVVQQKQGRVRATVQMRGAGLNDDEGLEREADAMGMRAAGLAAPLGPVQRANPVQSGAAIVQAKLKFGDHVFTDENFAKEPLPERLKPYHVAAGIYQIRDDWDADWAKIHLIYPDYVYLIGEIHASSTWRAQTKEWKKINKMREDMKALPGAEPEGAGPKRQSLESLHAFLLHICLNGKSEAVKLKASKSGATLPILKEIVFYAGQVWDAIPTYTKWVDALPAEQPSKIEDDFLTAYVKLANDASIAKTISEKMIEDLSKPAPDAQALDRIKTGNELLADQLGFFASLAAELTKVMRIAPDSASGKAIAADLKSKAPIAPKDSAAMAVREAEMVSRINAATRPLLVKIGDGHVEAVGAKVAKSIKIRAHHTLDTATKV